MSSGAPAGLDASDRPDGAALGRARGWAVRGVMGAFRTCPVSPAVPRGFKHPGDRRSLAASGCPCLSPWGIFCLFPTSSKEMLPSCTFAAAAPTPTLSHLSPAATRTKAHPRPHTRCSPALGRELMVEVEQSLWKPPLPPLPLRLLLGVPHTLELLSWPGCAPQHGRAAMDSGELGCRLSQVPITVASRPLCPAPGCADSGMLLPRGAHLHLSPA